MPATMNEPSVRSQLNSIHATSQPPVTATNRRDHPVLLLLRKVHRETDTSQQAGALSAGVPESQYGDGLNGTPNRNYAITWLYAQSDLFVLRFVEGLLEARGLTPDNKRAVRAYRIIELVKLLTEDV
jgi:hypothetical protein